MHMGREPVMTKDILAGTELKPAYGDGLPTLHTDNVHNEMSATESQKGQATIPLKTLLKDISAKGRPIRNQEELPTETVAPKKEYNPYKTQSKDASIRRQTKAEVEAKKDEEAMGPKTSMQDRAKTITDKVENGHKSSRQELVPDRERRSRKKDGEEDTREIAKKNLSKPRHFTMTREDRVAAAEARLGARTAFLEIGEKEKDD